MAHQSIWTHLFKTPFSLGTIDAGGVSTRYLDAGPRDAPVVLMLHGTAGSLENFCANIAAHANRFRVIAIDMLGCGFTDKPERDYLIRDYAEHALAVLDALRIESAHVIGVSLGSWVAAAMVDRAPARIKRMIMIAPAGIVVDADEERRVAEGIRARRSKAATQPTWETISAAMRGLVLDPATLMDDLIATRLAIYSDPRMAAAMPRLLAFSLGGQHLSETQWRAIRSPMLIIAAVDAPNMFLKNARALATIVPHAELAELQGCDHWAQYEQPDTFNRLSLEFLSRGSS